MDTIRNNLEDFLARFDDDSADRLIAYWTWLIGDDKTPIIVSAMGDMFLRDKEDNIFLLNAGEAILTWLLAD